MKILELILRLTQTQVAFCDENSQSIQQKTKPPVVSQSESTQPQKSKKKLEEEEFQKEEEMFIRDQKRKLIQFLQENQSQNQEEEIERERLREAYRRQSKISKEKFNYAQRETKKTKGDVIQETGKYSLNFLLKSTTDEVLYKYKRKLQKEIQWIIFMNQVSPIVLSTALYLITRRLKSKGTFDIMYFAVPYLYSNYSIFIGEQYKLFEIGYPAHPFIFQKRSEVINRVCYYYPKILKNEIEYLHFKLEYAKRETNPELTAEETRFEKTFTVGKKKLYTFKIIVQEGQLYLQCIDKFEDIFEISKDIVAGLELSDILDPFMFDNHKQIVNAMFEVYYELGTEYVQRCYFDQKDNQGKKVEEEAKDKIRRKHGLLSNRESDENKQLNKDAIDFIKDLKKN